MVACRYPHVHHEPLVHYSAGVRLLPEHHPEYSDHPAERVGRAPDAGIRREQQLPQRDVLAAHRLRRAHADSGWRLA